VLLIVANNIDSRVTVIPCAEYPLQLFFLLMSLYYLFLLPISTIFGRDAFFLSFQNRSLIPRNHTMCRLVNLESPRCSVARHIYNEFWRFVTELVLPVSTGMVSKIAVTSWGEVTATFRRVSSYHCSSRLRATAISENWYMARFRANYFVMGNTHDTMHTKIRQDISADQNAKEALEITVMIAGEEHRATFTNDIVKKSNNISSRARYVVIIKAAQCRESIT